MEHGNKYQKESLEKYKTTNNDDVSEIGIMICKRYPWFVYSPDKLLIKDGAPQKLIEIKCPYDDMCTIYYLFCYAI